VEVRVSYLEVNKKLFKTICLFFYKIYNESINDLLKKDNNNLDIRENLARGIYIQNLSEIAIKNENEALDNLYS